MLTHAQRGRTPLACAVLALGCAVSHGAVRVESTVAPSAGNHNPGGSISVASLTGGFFRIHDSTVLAETGSFQFSGLDGAGAMQTMTYTFDGAAQSDYGLLRSRFRSTIDNAYFNAANTRWIDDHATGSPSYFTGQSFARFSDEITVQASGAAASISFGVRITGEISATPVGSAGQIVLWRELPSGGTSNFRTITNPGGSGPLLVDEIVQTPTFAITDGLAHIGLGLQSLVSFSLNDSGLPDGASHEISSDAFNTMRIVEMIVRDASGGVLEIHSVTGQSGLDYVAFVPTPGTGAILACSALLAGRRRRVA